MKWFLRTEKFLRFITLGIIKGIKKLPTVRDQNGTKFLEDIWQFLLN